MFSSINFSKNSIQFLLIFIITIGLVPGCNRKSGDKGENSTTNPRDLAVLYLSQNNLPEAEAAFLQAIQKDPNDISNYISATRLYLLQKNYDDAVTQAKAGLKVKPENEDLKLLLADAYDLKGNQQESITELNEIIKVNPKNVKAYYRLAKIYATDSKTDTEKFYLLKVLNLVPANIVPQLQLAAILAGENKSDSSRFYMQSVKKIAPAFSEASEAFYQKAIAFLQGGQAAKALPLINEFHESMKVTPEYSAGKDDIEIPEMHAGFFDFDTNIHASATDTIGGNETIKSGQANIQVKFTTIIEKPQFTIGNAIRSDNSALAVTDYDAEGNMSLYTSYLAPGASSSKSYLSTFKMGSLQDCNVIGGIDHEGQDLYATFADYDNDGNQDLFIATTQGIIVYKNQGGGTFAKVTDNIGLRNTANVRKILFADFDQDGDLDMYVAQKGGNKFFRNNGDGTFTENAAAMGLTGGNQGTIDMDFGDYDEDGDLDIVTLADDGSVQLFNNNRHSNFKNITDSVGLNKPDYNGTAVAFGDYNNDGRLDILIAGGADGKCTLLKNESDHSFVPDVLASNQLSNSLKGVKVYDVAFIDYDNDGRQDIVVAGVSDDSTKKGVRLFHNDGSKGFSDVSSILPDDVMQTYHVGIADFNYDGDEDLFFAGPTGVQLARNDGGNTNNYIQVQLNGLSYGNSKNNRFGIGAQIELKAGDLYQLKTVKGSLTEFGVGARTKLDALRIIWPNGVPQTVVDPMRKQRVLEEEQLKGSCPFLFTWNGTKFEFQKDMLWRSALGIPVAIHGKDTTYAYSEPSKEYLLIPGEKLQPKNGLYTIKITEELWEAVYFDKANLIAVDHPDSVDVFADERFVAPPYPGKKVYTVAHQHLPVSATDEKGNDLMPQISKYDFQYVSNFSLGKFQGLAQDHDLILDLGDKANPDKLFLFLRGWVFPTDASINTELTQTNKYRIQPPSLQVINKEGKWQTVIKDIGYPMGRDKMVIANLSGKFLTAHDRRVRIRTNMQIYWDHIFFSNQNAKAPVEMHDLTMTGAQLNYRGYSASYHKGGPYGPQWFDYYNVTKGQKWRDLTGYYTRYGDVLPLLQKADDQYIIANSGDEITLDFDANNLPPLPKGWKRDFLIYSEGWVKDGDLNTAHGQTVGPLPFHKMPSYPYRSNIVYPSDKAHKEYQEKYNTRKVSTDDFTNAIRFGTYGEPKK